MYQARRVGLRAGLDSRRVAGFAQTVTVQGFRVRHQPLALRALVLSLSRLGVALHRKAVVLQKSVGCSVTARCL